jgi:formate dehydrogenase iron-sulfur subunit
MAYAFFIDTTVCTGCRGCQVACKQWHDLPAEQTRNRGTYENPPDLSFNTYKLVRMSEEVIDGRLRWLFFAEQCRHCIEAPCLEAAGEPGAIYRDENTGAIVYTTETRELAAEDIIQACPYNVPRKGPDGALAKCDMCNDRVRKGLRPACVKTCPTGAMNFGPRADMLRLARTRREEVAALYPQATLVDPDEVSTIYLIAFAPELYFENVIAAAGTTGITRQAALQRLLRPFSRAARAVAG